MLYGLLRNYLIYADQSVSANEMAIIIGSIGESGGRIFNCNNEPKSDSNFRTLLWSNADYSLFHLLYTPEISSYPPDSRIEKKLQAGEEHGTFRHERF